MSQPTPHTYNRKQRLQHARAWIEKYTGKHIHHGYAMHFGVSNVCAIKELEMLGFEFSAELKNSIIQSGKNKKVRQEITNTQDENLMVDSDDYFEFIAGYTSGGFAYGIPREHKENASYDNNSDVQKFSYMENDVPF